MRIYSSNIQSEELIQIKADRDFLLQLLTISVYLRWPAEIGEAQQTTRASRDTFSAQAAKVLRRKLVTAQGHRSVFKTTERRSRNIPSDGHTHQITTGAVLWRDVEAIKL
jgi:hypothetical protein